MITIKIIIIIIITKIKNNCMKSQAILYTYIIIV